MDSLVVYDDFYTNPLSVRQMALSLEYDNVVKKNYPGFQSHLSFTNECLEKKFEKILNRKLYITPEEMTFGKFRIMLKDTGSRLKVHVDGGPDWTGLIYLNEDNQAQGGTGFFKHKKTGRISLPSDEEAIELGYLDAEDYENKVIVPDSLNLEAWEMIDFIGMKFNRLVFFRGAQFFHAHTCSFGDSFSNGRLTQNFFFWEDPNADEC